MEYPVLIEGNIWLIFYGLAAVLFLLSISYIAWRYCTSPRLRNVSIYTALCHLFLSFWENVYLSFLWNEEKYRTWVAKEQRKKDKLAPDNVWDGLVHRADGREGVLVDETETETATVVNRLPPRKTSGLVESVVPTAKGRGRRGKSSSK